MKTITIPEDDYSVIGIRRFALDWRPDENGVVATSPISAVVEAQPLSENTGRLGPGFFRCIVGDFKKVAEAEAARGNMVFADAFAAVVKCIDYAQEHELSPEARQYLTVTDNWGTQTPFAE